MTTTRHFDTYELDVQELLDRHLENCKGSSLDELFQSQIQACLNKRDAKTPILLLAAAVRRLNGDWK